MSTSDTANVLLTGSPIAADQESVSPSKVKKSELLLLTRQPDGLLLLPPANTNQINSSCIGTAAADKDQ